MGNSKRTVQESHNSRNTNQTTFAPRSAQEEALLRQFQGLGDQQGNFLSNLFGGKSIFELSDQDKQQLDQSYQSAFDRFNLEGKDYADHLATTRGLNKSDTPVSQQAMERYGLGMSDLLSQKANTGLNMGMQGTMARLGAVGMTPGGWNSAFAPLYNERMAGGLHTQTGSGSSFQTMRDSPSLMSQIGQGMGLAQQGIGLGAQLGGMFMSPMGGMGGMGGLGGLRSFMPRMGTGMGSGASANYRSMDPRFDGWG